jgi:NADH-quinone oxidoreductase subunit J
VDFTELKRGLADYLPVGALIGLVLLIELGLVLGNWAFAEAAPEARAAAVEIEAGVPNTTAIGAILYDRYIYMFQAAGLILLVAMIGAIVLTLRHREGVKRQDVLAQMYRSREEAVELKDVKPGQGV